MGCIDKTFIYLWGLLGFKFVRDRQMPTEQREVGIWRSLYLSRPRLCSVFAGRGAISRLDRSWWNRLRHSAMTYVAAQKTALLASRRAALEAADLWRRRSACTLPRHRALSPQRRTVLWSAVRSIMAKLVLALALGAQALLAPSNKLPVNTVRLSLIHI